MSHMKQYLLENRHLGIAIKQVLNESGMTQVMLADRAEIPRNTLNRKINVGVFNFDELRRIASVTHRPLSSIIAMAEKLDTAENTIPALADQYGVRIPVNQTPLNERESWTLNSAAKVWNIDYHALLIAANNGTLTTFRPPSRRGTRSWRRVTRKAMEEFIAQFEE